MKKSAFLLLLLPLPFLMAPQAQSVVPPPTIDLATWRKYDLENRWLAYRRSIVEKRATLLQWVPFLDKTDDFELLEWISVYEGYQSLFTKGQPGEALVRRDAKQWMRVALWNINQRDGHNVTAATSPLESHPRRFLGWAQKFKEVRRLGGGALIHRLNDKFDVADPGDQLAPLDPMMVILPLLDVPKDIGRLPPGTHAEPRKRYEHQVLRAIGAVNIAATFREPYLGKLVRLLRHPNTAIRRKVMLEFTEFPAKAIPYEELLAVANDVTLSAEDRSLAMFAATYASHRAPVNLAMHAVLDDPTHPALRQLLSRIHGIGDPFTLQLLVQLTDRVPAELRPAVTRARVQMNKRLFPKDKRRVPYFEPVPLIHRVALARHTTHPLAARMMLWTKQHLRPRLGEKSVNKRVVRLLSNPSQFGVPPELIDEVKRVASEIRK